MFSFFKKSLKSKPKVMTLGYLGESVARQFLEERGFHFLGRNIAQKFGEIDLVLRAPDSTLVFVEVKTMSFLNLDSIKLIPEDNMTFSKMTKIRNICEFYANKYPHLISSKFGWRIDGAMVLVDKKFLNNQREFVDGHPFSFLQMYTASVIRWYENI